MLSALFQKYINYYNKRASSLVVCLHARYYEYRDKTAGHVLEVLNNFKYNLYLILSVAEPKSFSQRKCNEDFLAHSIFSYICLWTGSFLRV